MIEYKTGDILEANTEAIINTVNCVGIMGRGIALQFKNAYPENFKAYSKACSHNEVKPGHVFVFETEQLDNPRYIINFPTKRHWRDKSQIQDIEAGLMSLVDIIKKFNIRSIAIPPLGSGLGGLDWSVVKSRIELALQSLGNVQVIIYEPQKNRDPIISNRQLPAMTPGRAVLVQLMNCYLQGLLDPFVTLLEIHKLMYFMQEAGEPLKLNYRKAIYGPYAENLRHVLNAIEGHLISGYADGGDQPQKQLNLMPDAIDKARLFLQKHPDTLERFKRVTALIQGFESPFGLELLSTVHWIIAKEHIVSLDEIIQNVYNWNVRKQQFTKRQIELATEVLSKNDWINK